jgi:exonuclease III
MRSHFGSSPEQSACAQAPTLKNAELQHGTLASFFEALNADIVCLQETKLLPDGIPARLKSIAGWESFWSSSQDKKGYSGCATFVRLPYAAVAAHDDAYLPGATLPLP